MPAIKDTWRTTLKERLVQLTSEQRDQYSEAICSQILSSPFWKHSSVIALFSALDSEPQLGNLFAEGLSQQKLLLFPRIDKTATKLSFFEVRTLSELEVGSWGVLEPGTRCPAVTDLAKIDLICVPGLGFDRRGARLGRGKGYYDRALASFSPTTVKMGVFFSVQELNEVPEMSHDLRMDAIVTDRELILL